MKLVVKNQQGEDLSFDVLPEDTFHDIQSRLLQNGMVILDLTKLATADKPFSMSANVMEYFGVKNKTTRNSNIKQNNTEVVNESKLSKVCDSKANIVRQTKMECDALVSKNHLTEEPESEMSLQESENYKPETYHTNELNHNTSGDMSEVMLAQECISGEEPENVMNVDIDPDSILTSTLDYDCLKESDVEENSWQKLKDNIDEDIKIVFGGEDLADVSHPKDQYASDFWPGEIPRCRLCAEYIYDDEPFFIHSKSDENETTLADKINACLPIVVDTKDKMPKQICAECLVSLEASYLFSQCVTSAEDKLNSIQPKPSEDSLACPLCVVGSMASVEPEEHCSSDESSQSIREASVHTFSEERKPIDEFVGSKPKAHFITRTFLPLKRKRGRPRKYPRSNEDYRDWRITVEPTQKRASTRGRPRGSKNYFSKPKNLSCFICHLKIKDYKEALSHTLGAHCDEVNKTFPCPLCEDTLTGEQDLRLHIDTHNDSKEMVIVRCCLCEMVFYRLRDITDHWKEKHEKPLTMHFVCPVCDVTDTDAAGLANHVVTEHATHDHNTITCPICLQGFDIEAEVQQHFEENHIEKPETAVVCSECDVKLGSETEYSRHVIEAHCTTAVLKKPSYYNCNVCKNNFRSQYYLIKHTCNAVIDELHCKVCNKAYPTKARFVFHLQSHQPDLPEMRCHECWLFFTDEDTFYDHVRFQHEPEDQQQCKVCHKMFKNNVSLQIHMKRHITSRDHQCSKCDKKFHTAQTLREHLVSHMAVKPYQCHICGAYLSRLSRLRLHLRAHSARASKSFMKVFKCSECHQVFPNSKKAAKHSESHLNSKNVVVSSLDVSMVFRCEFCDGGFHQAAHLKQHRIDKHPNRDAANAYTCSVCGAQFSTYARVTTHKLSHGINTETLIVPDNGEEVAEETFAVPQYFLCHECDKRSLHYTYMSLHRRFQHTEGSAVYTCSICAQTFATAWSLQLHRKKEEHHQGGLKLASSVSHCKYCNKPYVTDTSLEAHIKRCHPNDTQDSLQTTFICETCGKTFQYKTLLDAHTDAHQGLKRFPCTDCDRRFTHKAGLIRHMKLHSEEDPFVCEFCGKKFRDRTERENHRRAHTGERPFMCHVCGRTFHTRAVWLDHSRIHEDIKPYRCEECGQSFRRSYALKSHALIHTGEKPFPCEYCGKTFRLKQSVFAHKKKEHSHLFNDELNETIMEDVLMIEKNNQFDNANYNESAMEDSEPDCLLGNESWAAESGDLSDGKSVSNNPLPAQGFDLMMQ